MHNPLSDPDSAGQVYIYSTVRVYRLLRLPLSLDIVMLHWCSQSYGGTVAIIIGHSGCHWFGALWMTMLWSQQRVKGAYYIMSLPFNQCLHRKSSARYMFLYHGSLWATDVIMCLYSGIHWDTSFKRGVNRALLCYLALCYDRGAMAGIWAIYILDCT